MIGNIKLIYYIIMKDEELKRLAEIRMLSEMEEHSALLASREEGIAEGMAKGIEKGRAEGRIEYISKDSKNS